MGYYTYDVTGEKTLDVLTPIHKNGNVEGALNIGIPVDSKTISKIVSGAMVKLPILTISFS